MSATGRLELEVPTLVVLVGPAGAGKTTFAQRHFLATEIVSSDACRALVGDDPTDQSASEDAFELLRFIARKRLRRKRLAVVDATNVREADRAPLVALARMQGAPATAVVFDLPLETCVERNGARLDQRVPERVVREQLDDLHEGLARLATEGFRDIRVFTSPDEVDAVEVGREESANA